MKRSVHIISNWSKENLSGHLTSLDKALLWGLKDCLEDNDKCKAAETRIESSMFMLLESVERSTWTRHEHRLSVCSSTRDDGSSSQDSLTHRWAVQVHVNAVCKHGISNKTIKHAIEGPFKRRTQRPDWHLVKWKLKSKAFLELADMIDIFAFENEFLWSWPGQDVDIEVIRLGSVP